MGQLKEKIEGDTMYEDLACDTVSPVGGETRGMGATGARRQVGTSSWCDSLSSPRALFAKLALSRGFHVAGKRKL